MNYKIWFFYNNFWRGFKDVTYFLFCLPLIIVPPLWFAAFFIGCRPTTARPGTTRQVSVFAFFPERVGSGYVWLRKFKVTQIYTEVGRGMGVRSFGWRKGGG